VSVWDGEALVVVGHRGVREAPEAENTMAAFERALDVGARAVELDVRLCATGEVVVFHDPDLARATDRTDSRRVRYVPYAELAGLRLFGAGQGVPLLADVLALVLRRGAGVNVELKHDDVDHPRLVRSVARALDDAMADVLVSSFDPRLLARLKAARPKTRIAMLTTEKRRWSLPLARALARALHAVHLERTQATVSVVRSLKRRTRVGVWTVNDVEEIQALQRLGVDWIITDKPALRLGGSVAPRHG
jgi:glycerophosphoryl diester phosphodiesterase